VFMKAALTVGLGFKIGRYSYLPLWPLCPLRPLRPLFPLRPLSPPLVLGEGGAGNEPLFLFLLHLGGEFYLKLQTYFMRAA
jgi:hypothetical protein